jgi:hypothetical protein
MNWMRTELLHLFDQQLISKQSAQPSLERLPMWRSGETRQLRQQFAEERN